MRGGRFRRGDETRARPGLTLAAAFAVLLGLAALATWLLMTRPAGDTAHRLATPRASGANTEAGVRAASSSGDCNVAGDATTSGLTAVPADLTWAVVDGAVVPSSPAAGPTVVDNGVGRCYAHDAEGALIASVRIQEAVLSATPATWPQAQAGLTPGAFTDALVTEVDQVLARPQPPADTEPVMSAVAGFNFLSYSPSTCVVQLVYRAENGTLYQAEQTMQWAAGDWRLSPLSATALSSPVSVVPNLLGYVTWSQP